MSDDDAARASHNCEQDVSLQILERVKFELEEIARSLERIDEGAYGRCEDCGEPIPPARLEALPTASQCVGCKSKLENA